jgi:hypothetical protein
MPFRSLLAAIALTAAATAAHAAPMDVVTKRFPNAWVDPDSGDSLDIMATFDPDENFANKLDPPAYGIGGGWFHDGIYSGGAELTYTFVDPGTETPRTLSHFAYEISDIDANDGHGLSKEIFRVDGVDRVETLPDGLLNVEERPGPSASVEITATDNRNETLANNALLHFSDQASVVFDYEAKLGWKFRNGGGIRVVDPTAERFASFTTAAEAVPAPATPILLAGGVLAIAVGARRRRRDR